MAEYCSGISNGLILKRPYYTLAAFEESKDFLLRIQYKMAVHFKNEEQAIDVGGVTRDFLSHLFDRFTAFLLKERKPFGDKADEPGPASKTGILHRRLGLACS